MITTKELSDDMKRLMLQSDRRVLVILQGNLETLRELNPNEKDERSYQYAIAIAGLERIVANFEAWIKSVEVEQ